MAKNSAQRRMKERGSERRPQPAEIMGGGKFYTALNVLLFAVMAEMAYIIVIFFTDVLKRCTDGDAFSLWIFVLAPVVFCLLVFGLLRLNRYINRRYPSTVANVFITLLFFMFMGVVFWNFNYLLYVVTVASSNHDSGSPFIPVDPIWGHITLVSLIELIIVCLIALNQTTRYTVRLLRESENLRRTQARAEVRALQTQLNPHFLFNSLNTLISEIDNDTEAAKRFTIDLAGAYRYILQKQDKPLVSVYEELEFLQTYIRLNRIRVGENLTYSCVYPDQTNLDFLQYRYLPSLSLQLLAENALKHNVVSTLKPLNIQIDFSKDLKYLVMCNNINPKKNVVSLGTGLANLSERYRLLAGEEIIVEKTQEYFSVKIPMLDGNENRQ